MFLLISKQGEVLGQTLSPENAYRQAMIARTTMFAVTKKEELRMLPAATRTLLWDDYASQSLDDLWNALEKNKFPYWGKVSVMRVLRHLYADKACSLTQDELLAKIPGATWIAITTAMSMLKNKKYSDGKPLLIEQAICPKCMKGIVKQKKRRKTKKKVRPIWQCDTCGTVHPQRVNDSKYRRVE